MPLKIHYKSKITLREKSIHSLQVNQFNRQYYTLKLKKCKKPNFVHVSFLEDFSKPGCEVLGPYFY